jgi:hypothetical protein
MCFFLPLNLYFVHAVRFCLISCMRSDCVYFATYNCNMYCATFVHLTTTVHLLPTIDPAWQSFACWSQQESENSLLYPLLLSYAVDNYCSCSSHTTLLTKLGCLVLCYCSCTLLGPDWEILCIAIPSSSDLHFVAPILQKQLCSLLSPSHPVDGAFS